MPAIIYFFFTSFFFLLLFFFYSAIRVGRSHFMATFTLGGQSEGARLANPELFQ